MAKKQMLQAPSIYVTKLAKSGHAESLDTLLNYFMQKIGTTARSSVKNGLIELILEGYTSTPDQEQSEKYLRSLFDYLQIPTLQEVRIFAKNYDTQRLAWWSTLEMNSPRTTLNTAVHSNSKSFYTSVEQDSDHPTPHLAHAWIAGRLQPPQPIAFEKLPANLQRNIQRVGLRRGETRTYHEARQIYEMMPENVRRGGADAVGGYKQKHDWSHKKAHSKGGSNHPNNGDWEISNINRSRGSRQMTKVEADNIAKAKAQINFQEGTKIVGLQAAKAGGIAFGVEVAFSGLDNFLAVQRGEKTVEQALGDTLANATGAAVVAVAVIGGVSALTLIFPPVGVVLGTATAFSQPFLQIVGVVGSMTRLVTILSNSGKVQGIDQVEAFMMSYGIDHVELDFRDLEVEADLLNLKLAMQQVD